MTVADRDESDEERKALASVTALDVRRKDEQPIAYQRAPIDWPASDERGAPPSREWAVEGWLGMGYTTLLSGLGGIGKSILTQQMATALVADRDFIAAVPQERTVLLWAGEDDEDELIRRQIAICTHYGVRQVDLDKRLIIQPLLDVECCLMDVVSGKPLRTSMLKELREQMGDYRADVCILDNIGRLFGGNENDRHHVTSFMSALAWAGQPSKAAMLLIGHVAKLTGSEYSGSTAWENACRARLYFGDKPPDAKPENDGEGEGVPTDLRYLSKRKVNYTSRDLCTMVYDQGIYNIITAPTSGGVVDSINRAKAREVVLAGLSRLASLGIIPVEATNSPHYLPRALVEYKLAENLSKRDLGQAMRALMVDGAIKREQIGQYPNRSPRFGLVVI